MVGLTFTTTFCLQDPESILSRVRCTEKYDQYLGSVEICKEDFQLRVNNGNLQRDLWRKTVRAKFTKEVSECPLHFKHSAKVNSRCRQRGVDNDVTLTIPVYSRCIYRKCRLFRLDILQTDAERFFMDVKSTDNEIYHKGKRTTHLKSIEREEEKDILATTKPARYQRQCVKD